MKHRVMWFDVLGNARRDARDLRRSRGPRDRSRRSTGRLMAQSSDASSRSAVPKSSTCCGDAGRRRPPSILPNGSACRSARSTATFAICSSPARRSTAKRASATASVPVTTCRRSCSTAMRSRRSCSARGSCVSSAIPKTAAAPRVHVSPAARPRWWRRRSSSSASSPRRHAWPHRHQPQARRSAREG